MKPAPNASEDGQDFKYQRKQYINQTSSKQVLRKSPSHILTSNFRDRERIKGYVEEEMLWKLQKCLIGYTAVEGDTTRLQDNLCRWGLGEIKIKKMAGRVFLLEIEDVDVYNSLKDSGWSYLKEVFTEVHPWSESFRSPERVVWLEMVGVPLHCWNQNTFKRIA
ncbi:hypothetical protein V6N13_129005 [Hibiscus sabdariffa]